MKLINKLWSYPLGTLFFILICVLYPIHRLEEWMVKKLNDWSWME